MAVGRELPSPPPVPDAFTLTSVVVPLPRSRRKTFNFGTMKLGRELLPLMASRLSAVLANRT